MAQSYWSSDDRPHGWPLYESWHSIPVTCCYFTRIVRVKYRCPVSYHQGMSPIILHHYYVAFWRRLMLNTVAFSHENNFPLTVNSVASIPIQVGRSGKSGKWPIKTTTWSIVHDPWPMSNDESNTEFSKCTLLYVLWMNQAMFGLRLSDLNKETTYLLT